MNLQRRKMFFLLAIGTISIMYLLYDTSPPLSYYLNSKETFPLLNISKFTYLLDPHNLCTKDINLLIAVHTARDNFQSRESIRNTYGSLKHYKQWNISLVFFLGRGQQLDPIFIEHVLEEESKNHSDIVVGDFLDTYKNLSYKHLMIYKWAEQHCSSSLQFILKVDDDIFVNIFQVMDTLIPQLQKDNNSHGCVSMYGNGPQRDPLDKWYVSQDDYPYTLYPDYCSGSAYILAARAIRSILWASQNITYTVWVDDAFVTGILRDGFNKIMAAQEEKISLGITNMLEHYYFFPKRHEYMLWCSKDDLEPIPQTYVFLSREDVFADMECMWMKTVKIHEQKMRAENLNYHTVHAVHF